MSGVSRESRDPSPLRALELAGRDLERTSSTPSCSRCPTRRAANGRSTVVVLASRPRPSLAMVVALRRDVAYALASSTPGGLGDLRTATGERSRQTRTVWCAPRRCSARRAGIRYERPFVDDTFRTLPVAGARPDIWVDVRVPAGQESGRWEPPRAFTGRLVRFDAPGRVTGASRGPSSRRRRTVPAGAWLLVDGEAPESARWTTLLAAMFLGFAVWNAAAIARIVRKVR